MITIATTKVCATMALAFANPLIPVNGVKVRRAIQNVIRITEHVKKGIAYVKRRGGVLLVTTKNVSMVNGTLKV